MDITKNIIKIVKVGVVIFIGLIILVALSPSKEIVYEEKIVEVEKIIEVEKEVECKNLEFYEELKEVDEAIMTAQSLALVLAGEGFNAVAEADLVKLENISIQITAMSPVIDELFERRNEIIEKIQTN